MKKKMALCTPIPEELLNEIREYCEVTVAGELKHGRGNVTEEMTCAECSGYEIVALGDEYAHADTINTWIESGMKFIGVAKGTPVTVDNEPLKAAGIKLAYTPGRNAIAVAEYCIGLMIGATRNMVRSGAGLLLGEHLAPPSENIYDVPDIKNVVWGPLDENSPYTDYGIGFELYGKTLGLIGFGAIGREVGKRALAFGMKVLAYDPYVAPEKINETGAEAADLDATLSRSDVISIHLPVIEETRGLIDKEWFRRMKPTAYLINTARAAVINQKDLIEALQNKEIAGAGLDVFWEEPVPENHPLLNMKNVTCTPHMAGLTKDVDAWSGRKMAQNILAYLKGEEIPYVWKR